MEDHLGSPKINESNFTRFALFSHLVLLALNIGIVFHWQSASPPEVEIVVNKNPFPPPPCLLTETSGSQAEQDIQILTQQVGRIQANLLRINALGERIVEAAKLDPMEFNFHQEVGIGGEESLATLLSALEALLEKRNLQLLFLDRILQSDLHQQELAVSGQGKSVTQGWISSFFGPRYDPFTGRKAWHAGVDIAGKEGAPIKALASGVVSLAQEKGGYGQLVEINHGNGLTTRYGHNKALLVQPGDLVKKGQPIALLGSSGRSTGPHVHLEVRKYGEAVDPGEYFPDLRRRS